MNTAISSTSSKVKSMSSKASNALSSFSFGGISLPEIAILGAAGYVLWKNRSKIQNLLEENGIETPEILSGSFSDVVQAGASLLSAGSEDRSGTSGKSSRTRKHDA